MNAFLTGSHVYGTPTKDSDIDLVVRVDDDTASVLFDLSEMEGIRFGKLNIIACQSDEQFQAWKDGTDELEAMSLLGEVTRDAAVKHFQGIFEARGLSLGYLDFVPNELKKETEAA